MEPHWGPRIDKIPINGFIGLVVCIGLMFGFIMEVPAIRLWLFISIPLGILIGFILYLRHR
jgi:hypothetical protein